MSRTLAICELSWRVRWATDDEPGQPGAILLQPERLSVIALMPASYFRERAISTFAAYRRLVILKGEIVGPLPCGAAPHRSMNLRRRVIDRAYACLVATAYAYRDQRSRNGVEDCWIPSEGADLLRASMKVGG